MRDGAGQGRAGAERAGSNPTRNDAGWSELVGRARSILQDVAARGATITYGELRDRLGGELPHRGEGDLAAVLRAASLVDEGEGRGLVSAVVVGASGRPGAGWFRLAAEMGRDVGDEEEAWRRERARLAGETPGASPHLDPPAAGHQPSGP